jgi:hypothetical protein
MIDPQMKIRLDYVAASQRQQKERVEQEAARREEEISKIKKILRKTSSEPEK